MKNILLLTICSIWILLDSCQKCDLISQEKVYPDSICEGTFYFNNLISAMDTNYTFNDMAKPILDPTNPIQKAGPFGIPFGPFSMKSNFSAYDSINGIYVFEYVSTSNPIVRFYSNQTATNVSTQSTFLDLYVSPVFQGGRLYTIFLETFGSDLQYSIGEVNPITGQDGTGLAGSTVAINSPANQYFTSSAAAKNNLIYFLTGTNLIEFNTLTTATRYFDIDPSYNQISNNVTYLGLEYDLNQDLLLCMKNGPDGMGGTSTTIISIKIMGGGTQLSQVFDMTSHFPPGHSTAINLDFYSTTLDACDTTYYVTELNGGNPLTTNFIEIGLHDNDFKLTTVDGYWYGMEFASKN